MVFFIVLRIIDNIPAIAKIFRKMNLDYLYDLIICIHFTVATLAFLFYSFLHTCQVHSQLTALLVFFPVWYGINQELPQVVLYYTEVSAKISLPQIHFDLPP